MSAETLIQAAQSLCDEIAGLDFAPPVAYVYNPLIYAHAGYEAYLRRYGNGRKRVVFLGMNPGPFGMAQTGVPFGDVKMVRDWMGIEAPIGKPPKEHPKRPIDGFACKQSEVSGTRLWGAAAERYGTPEAFFKDHFVLNYCPLVFMEASGANRTPDKLPVSERTPLFEACDRHLARAIADLEPEWVVGVGAFAQARAKAALAGMPVKIGRVLHPSPASPAANRGWAQAAAKELEAQGICLVR
ncbi:single-stranded DNA-binding protein [bacterium]|nr:single-stranded DNA-binding protein [bacterium]